MELPFVSRKRYDELVYKLECLLCHATGGKLSKSTYSLLTMQYAVTDYINESVDYLARALICDEVEENERLHASYTELTQKCASLIEENERLRAELEQRPPKLIITKLLKKENENVCSASSDDNIYQRIKKARKAKGWTMQELAEKVGYSSRSAIARVETGDRSVNHEMLVKYAEALEVSPLWLLYGDEYAE